MLFCWQTCYAITVWQSSPCDPFDPFAIFFNASQHAVHRRRLWQRQLVMQPWPYRTVGWEQLVCGFHFMSSIEMMEVPLQDITSTVACQICQEKVRNKEQYVSRLQDRDPKTAHLDVSDMSNQSSNVMPLSLFHHVAPLNPKEIFFEADSDGNGVWHQALKKR